MKVLVKLEQILENEITKPVLSYSSSKALNEEQLKKSEKIYNLKIRSVYGYSTTP